MSWRGARIGIDKQPAPGSGVTLQVCQPDTAPTPISATQALAGTRAWLGSLAAVDPVAMPAQVQAECLRGLEQIEATLTAARAQILGAFTAAQGYSADADYSARAWLIHKTGVTKGAAAGHIGWSRRTVTHPQVLAALAEGIIVSESLARKLCGWTDKLPQECRQPADEILLAAARAGADERDLAGLAAEIRARAPQDDKDDDRGFEDRTVRLETTFDGAGLMTGDLTPECTAIVSAVLDALSAPMGAEDTRTQGQRYHDGLQEAMRRLAASRPAPRTGRPAREGPGPHLPRRAPRPRPRIGPARRMDHRGAGQVGRGPGRRFGGRRRRRRLAGRGRCPRRDLRRDHHPRRHRRRGHRRPGRPGQAVRPARPPRPRPRPGRARLRPGRRRPRRTRPPGPRPRPARRCRKPSSARPSTSCPAPAASPASCAPANSAPGWPAPACRWTSATPRPSRPRSATRSSCGTSTASGPAAAASPPGPARSTTSSTRPTAAPPASKAACLLCFFHHQIVHPPVGLDPGPEPGRDDHRLEPGPHQGAPQPRTTSARRVTPRPAGDDEAPSRSADRSAAWRSATSRTSP